MAVHKSSAAEADLEKIWIDAAIEYGVLHAQRVLQRLDELFQLLHDFSGIGLEYSGIPPEVRYFPVKPYPFLIFFDVVSDGIRIVRVLPDKVQVVEQF